VNTCFLSSQSGGVQKEKTLKGEQVDGKKAGITRDCPIERGIVISMKVH